MKLDPILDEASNVVNQLFYLLDAHTDSFQGCLIMIMKMILLLLKPYCLKQVSLMEAIVGCY
jgi:hypothetical protein